MKIPKLKENKTIMIYHGHKSLNLMVTKKWTQGHRQSFHNERICERKVIIGKIFFTGTIREKLKGEGLNKCVATLKASTYHDYYETDTSIFQGT